MKITRKSGKFTFGVIVLLAGLFSGGCSLSYLYDEDLLMGQWYFGDDYNDDYLVFYSDHTGDYSHRFANIFSGYYNYSLGTFTWTSDPDSKQITANITYEDGSQEAKVWKYYLKDVDGTNHLDLKDSSGDEEFVPTAYGIAGKLDVIQTYVSPDSKPHSIAFDGTYLWLIGDANNLIYKLNGDCQVVSTINPGLDYEYHFSIMDIYSYGLVYYNNYLYALAKTDTSLIYKIDPSSGTVVSTISKGGSESLGMTVLNDQFWVIGASYVNGEVNSVNLDQYDLSGNKLNSYSSWIVSGLALKDDTVWGFEDDCWFQRGSVLSEIDASNGSISTASRYRGPAKECEGVTYDGTYFWVVSGTNIYKTIMVE